MADEAVKAMVDSTMAFLDSLDAGQREAAVLPFNSDERLNWHYVPKDRKGIAFQSLNEKQTGLALDLLKTALSTHGYEKVETIRGLEDILHEIEGGRGPARDTQLYYFTVFGEPAATGSWGLRYEGHHLSLNWTMLNGKVIASYPQFLGANPAEVLQGPSKGLRALADEEDLARALLDSLDEAQRSAAVLSDTAPPEILTRADREAAIQENLGVAYADLSSDQQGTLISIIQLYASTMRKEVADERMGKLRAAGLEEIKFAWMGGLKKGEKHYYRIQGPTFIIEYDNTQNNANHIHTVWRDFRGDFGIDVLKEHYKAHASAEHPEKHEH
ncbi:MAG: hypothetical protein AMXMBFR4_06330 [Candidatus Hydrogenedentota bacterium]